MQRRFWAGAVRPFGFPSLNVLRLPSKRLRNGHLAWGDFASKLSFERTIHASSRRCPGAAAVRAGEGEAEAPSDRGEGGRAVDGAGGRRQTRRTAPVADGLRGIAVHPCELLQRQQAPRQP